jgi:hypothetical protein
VTLLTIAEGAHSELGPSSAERWLICTASVAATRGLPDRPSQYAIEGTAAHTVSEWVRERGVPAKSFIGTTVRVTRGDTHHDVEITDEFAASVQEFCDKVAEQPGYELIEARVSYDKYVAGGFGTLDSAKLMPGLGRVTDFKHGTGVKKWAKENPQLKLYALGIYLEWDYLFGFEKFVLAISQPRLDHYAEWEISVKDLLTWAETEVATAVDRIGLDATTFKAGEHCQFCKIKATCRERARTMFEAATGSFEDVDSAVAAVPAASQPATLSNEELAKILGVVDQLKSWCKAVEAHAEAEMRAGRQVGDFKFVAGRTSRAWKAGVDVEALWKKLEYSPEDLYTEPELISPAQAEKLIGKKPFAVQFVEAVEKSKGKPTLVRGTDPRPAISLAELAGFVELPEE